MISFFRYSSIFKSRWIALVWAAGMIWFALDIAEPPPSDGDNRVAATDITGAPITSGDERQIADIINSL